MRNFLQINKFFVSVVTLCDIFHSRFKRFFGLNVFLQNRFLLKKLATCSFFAVFCILFIARSVFPGKNMAFLTFNFFKI